MSTTEFTPERSAAIRQLLIDTVEDEPRRRKRLQILLTSVLSGVAVALAGGTAALALTGVLHFGSGDAPPVPAPTSTPTPTPTLTPTPTPTSLPRPLVQSAAVLPHDVDSLRPTQRWALDLPGDPACTITTSYTLSDARAVYVSGLRPKEYEGSDCVNHVGEDMGVTLVDTSNGQILWQREWKFTPKNLAFGAGFAVLGTSGRAVFTSAEAGVGPHDVLDLETGRTVGTFEPAWDGFRARDMQPVPDASGDIVVVEHFNDDDGRAVKDDVVTRADPADFGNPEWSVSIGLTGSYLGAVAPDGTAMAVEGYAGSSDRDGIAILNLRTGTLSTPVEANNVQAGSQILYGTSASRLSAYGADGQVLWSRPLAEGSYVYAVSSPGTMPGFVNGYRMNDTGELLVVDDKSLAAIDQTTGDVRWTTPKPGCMQGSYETIRGVLDVRRDVFLLPSSQAMCAVSHDTGASVDAPALPGEGVWGPIGLTHRYSYPFGADDPGSAYDLQTGNRLWTRERHDYDAWSFDGGYLVSKNGNHVESIG